MSIPRMENMVEELTKLNPHALQQFAATHQNDTMALIAAKAASEEQKKIMAAGRPQQVGMPPKVNQQVVASMAPPQAPQAPMQSMQAPQAMPQDQGLPEDSGIAQLPAPNMKRMAGGGIVAFARGGDAGSDPAAAYRQYAMTKAQQMGVNPKLVDSIFNIESGYDPEAKSGTGPVGIGQLTKKTGKAYGVSPEDRTDPYKNIDASIAFMADLQKKYGNDPAKIAVAYNQGESVLNKHLKDNKGTINASSLPSEAKGYLKKLNDLIPLSSAQAEEVPSAPKATKRVDTPNTAADTEAFQSDPMNFYVPDQGGAAPKPRASEAAPAAAPSGPQKPWYDRAREALTSGEGQRQMLLGAGDMPYDILGAPADIGAAALRPFGYTAEPTLGSQQIKRFATKYLGREADSPDSALQGLRTVGGLGSLMVNPSGVMSKVANAGNLRTAEAAMAAANEAKAAKAGVSNVRLENPYASTAMVTNAAGDTTSAARLRAVENAMADEAKAKELAKVAQTNTAAAQGLPSAEQIAAMNARAARAGDVARGTTLAAQIPQAAQVAADATADNTGIAALTNAGTSGSPDISAGPDVVEEAAPATETAEAPAAPATNPDEWTKDDWLALAAGLGSNKSQYFTEALGGGLANLVANRTSRKKFELDKALNAAHVADLQGRAGLYPSKAELNAARIGGIGGAQNSRERQLQANVLKTQLSAALKTADDPMVKYDPVEGPKAAAVVAGLQRQLAALANPSGEGTMVAAANPQTTSGWGQAIVQ